MGAGGLWCRVVPGMRWGCEGRAAQRSNHPYPYVHVAVVCVLYHADAETVALVLLVAGEAQNTIWRTTQQLRRMTRANTTHHWLAGP